MDTVNWIDVQADFDMDEPEPDRVYFYQYDENDYDGYAICTFRDGDKYYLATGSHCSCFDLTGQWEPEEYETRELFVKALQRIAFSWHQCLTREAAVETLEEMKNEHAGSL